MEPDKDTAARQGLELARQFQASRQNQRRRQRYSKRGKTAWFSGWVTIEREDWPPRPQHVTPPYGCERFHQNEALFVMECVRPGGVHVLIVRRLCGRDGIPWEALQGAKDALGFDDREAVEIYPKNGLVVNEQNLRWLWVLPKGDEMPFGLDAARDRRGL